MKNLFTILVAVLLTVKVFAQAPEKMSYQAVIRNSSNALVTSQAVGMKISILQGSASGTPVYVETQTTTTNANGLVTVEIGDGNVVSGTFATINWANGSFYIKTETDTAGGNNYSISGISELLSVPYALHAKTAENFSGTITETDPVFDASPASGLTSSNLLNWNTAYSWGNHATAGYLTSFTETDPVWNLASLNYYTKTNMQTSGQAQLHFNNITNKPTTLSGFGITDAMNTSHVANGITSTNTSNWNTAFGWGNHATAGYLTTFTETDPIWNTASTNYYTKTNMQTSGQAQLHFNNITNKPTTIAGYGITNAMTTAHAANGITSTNISNWNTAYGWGNHASLYYTKTQMQTSGQAQLHFNNITNKPTTIAGYGITNAMTTTHAANGITSTNISNWTTAFGWGNHAGLYRPINYVPSWSQITSNPFVFTSVANNQLLKYNSTSAKWENWTPNFLTSFTEVDGSITNEIQTLSLAGNQLSISGGNSVTLPSSSTIWTDSGANTYLTTTTDLLGVGTTAPNSKLHVNSATGENGLRVQINGSTKLLVGSAGGVSVGANTAGPANGLYVLGNVGIGISTPAYKLDVGGTINSTGFRMATTPVSGYVLTSDASGNGTWQPASGGGGSLWTDGGATSYLTATTDNVGIGTNTANSKLDVRGNLSIGATTGSANILSNATSTDYIRFISGGGLELMSQGTGDDITLNTQGGGDDIFIQSDGIISLEPLTNPVYVFGNLQVSGSVSKASGSFKIDHPLDPANKYLYHSFVESPDMMNVYNGNSIADANGEAVVILPDYFENLNSDFRYQLTAVGTPSPNLYIKEKIQNNQFIIAGANSGSEISWQVTGIRKDAWANEHRIIPEVEKESVEKGKYLHPELFNQPKEKRIIYHKENDKK